MPVYVYFVSKAFVAAALPIRLPRSMPGSFLEAFMTAALIVRLPRNRGANRKAAVVNACIFLEGARDRGDNRKLTRAQCQHLFRRRS